MQLPTVNRLVSDRPRLERAQAAAPDALLQPGHGDATPRGDRPRRRGLRIAIVTPEVGIGAGVSQYWQALAVALSKHNQVHVFAARANQGAIGRAKFHRIPTLHFGWTLAHATFYLAARARFALARLLRHQEFDIVFGIGALTPFADVTTVHFVQARELGLQQKGAFPRERLRGGLASLDYALYGHAMNWLGRRFYRNAHAHVIAISQRVKRDLVHLEGAQSETIAVVPNGVDIERFSPRNRQRFRVSTRRELGLTDEQIAVLFVGNSWGRKGLQTAVEAISGPGLANVRLVVVGEGVAAPFTRGLPPEVAARIVFAGAHHGDVQRFYAAADVFLLPTLYEPFGLVILEALASGLPTIVSAGAGASEWLKDGFDAVLLRDPADGDEARAALRTVIGCPDFADELAINGRSKAVELQWSAIATRLLEASPIRGGARAHEHRGA